MVAITSLEKPAASSAFRFQFITNQPLKIGLLHNLLKAAGLTEEDLARESGMKEPKTDATGPGICRM